MASAHSPPPEPYRIRCLNCQMIWPRALSQMNSGPCPQCGHWFATYVNVRDLWRPPNA